MIINELIIKRVYGNIGWIKQLEFIDIETHEVLKLKSYNGCLCFQIGKKRIGYRTFERKSVATHLVIIKKELPF